MYQVLQRGCSGRASGHCLKCGVRRDECPVCLMRHPLHVVLILTLERNKGVVEANVIREVWYRRMASHRPERRSTWHCACCGSYVCHLHFEM